MNQSKISVRYAKALFQVAQGNHNLDAIKNDMELVALFCKQADFNLLLESPVVNTKNKKATLSSLFDGKINALTLKFLLMVTENKREIYIPDISRNFISQYLSYKGIKAAKVVTASKIDEQTKDNISSVISQMFKTDLELSVEENPEIIGGFVLRVGDEQIDASVATKLKKIKREFLDTSV